MKLIDLTHTFTNEMPLYTGTPSISLKQITTIGEEGYNDHEINTSMHVGTHMDAPLHMIENGKSINELSLDTFIGFGVLIDARNNKEIDESLLDNVRIEKESIVLIFTDFGSRYRTDSYYKNHPTVTENFAKRMLELNIKMIGMDMPSPDKPPFPIHKILLGNNIPFLENLTNLDQLLGIEKFEVIALPAKFKADGAPVRVIAKVFD